MVYGPVMRYFSVDADSWFILFTFAVLYAYGEKPCPFLYAVYCLENSDTFMENSVTYFGKAISIENGGISSKENIIIDCKISAKLISTADVVIGTNSKFEGLIIAHNLEINGTFTGEAYVKNNLVIKSGSTVKGKMKAFCLNIESGASFDGQSSTISQDEFLKYAGANRVYSKLTSDIKLLPPVNKESSELQNPSDTAPRSIREKLSKLADNLGIF